MAKPMTASQFVAALKKEGVKVSERYSGWRTHNRNHKGAWGNVNGVVIHHTAGRNSVSLCYNGTSALPGPLCHTHLAKDGTATMMSAGRANHAGSFPANAFNAMLNEAKTHPRPAGPETVDANARTYGIEIENLGNGRDVYPSKQYDAAVRWAAAICRFHGWTANSVIGHKEGTTRKIDPKGPVQGKGDFDMHDFRRDVQARLDGKPTTPKPDPKPEPKPGTITPKSRESAATVKAQAERALKDWPFIPAVEKKHGLPAGLLLAVGSRETNLVNKVGDGGHGHGVWQQDDRWWKVPAGFDKDVQAQAEKAAKLLADNIKAVGLPAGVAAYNAGLTGVKNALAAGKSADSATTGGDYAADVLGRMAYADDVKPTRVLEWQKVEGYMPELRYGDENWHVDFLQRMLNRFISPNLKVDGKYGQSTADAVHKFYREQLDYTTTTKGRVFSAGGWRRVLSVAETQDGKN
ncbi:N-acetylmuramoyl-L-alanine amidase [Streptomyces ovatisporus]|uniref:N-acetylmuramoyl-L-alanine amidase n=1 Tax=Streptomyces ovatisporus TaxID=1128682 RepID=A0ABV9A3A0_9ACTN